MAQIEHSLVFSGGNTINGASIDFDSSFYR